MNYSAILYWMLPFVLARVLSAEAGNKDFQIFPKSSVITGSVKSSEECPQGEIQIWISEGSTLIYQGANRSGGTFEFHIMPGDYEITAIDPEGCFFGKTLQVKADQVSTVQVVLKPQKNAQVETRGGQ